MAFYSGNTTNEEDFLGGEALNFLFEYMDDDEFKLKCDDALVEDPQQVKHRTFFNIYYVFNRPIYIHCVCNMYDTPMRLDV